MDKYFINGFTIYVSKPRPSTEPIKEKPITLNDECCLTCKHCEHKDYYCNCLHTSQKNNLKFVCDFYRRKCSGAYRRKRAKYNRGNI